MISRNKRLEKFVCKKCLKEYTQDFEEFWEWTYTGGTPVYDKNGDFILKEDGTPFIKGHEWKLKPCRHRRHTLSAICVFCGNMDIINLTKKEYNHLRRPPPTEREITRDIKEDWR